MSILEDQYPTADISVGGYGFQSFDDAMLTVDPYNPELGISYVFEPVSVEFFFTCAKISSSRAITTLKEVKIR